MCNPRRVVIKLAQAVREQWQRKVSALVEERTEIEAQATIETQVDLAAELGAVALDELRALLAEGYAGWRADGPAFTLALDHGIVLRYSPGDGRLQIQARLHETIAAAASASQEASGTVEGVVEVEGVGRYYDDGWGGRTAEHARRDAERNAQDQMAAAQARLRAQQQRDALAAAHQQASEQARAAAQARLHDEAERRRAVLEEQLERRLRDSEDQVQAALGALLGQTYRRALIRLVQESNGQIIQDQQHGAVIELVARI
jgi:hypothetical protein